MNEAMNEELSFGILDAEGAPVRSAMQALQLTGRLLPVGAVLGIRHVFSFQGRRPQELIYAFPLPQDAALRRFRVLTRAQRIESELRPVDEAAQLYEQGVADGHLAVLAREYRDGIVNLTVGNVLPEEPVEVDLEIVAGVELRDGRVRFRFPFSLAPGYHAQASMDSPAPGTGRILLPEDLFGDVFLPEWRRDAAGLHRVGFTLEIAMPSRILEVASPSHSLRVENRAPGRAVVSLARESDVPNRDLVLDVAFEGAGARVLGGPAGGGRVHFAVTVPSSAFSAERAARAAASRRLVFVLDRSGSMSGVPMVQAKNALSACLGVLGIEDRFNIVAFDDGIETFQGSLVSAGEDMRSRASEFLNSIDARGGTDLAPALSAAAAMFEGQGGEIFLITDGQVFGTEPIIGMAESSHVRIHALGIGSAGRDRFLAAIARSSGGVSRSVTPRERVDEAALELFGSISRPVAEKVRVRLPDASGSELRLRPAPAGEVFEGAPLVVFGDLPRADSGVSPALQIEWRPAGGGKVRRLEVPLTDSDFDLGEAIRLLQGARLITELENQGAAAGESESSRAVRRLWKMLEKASREFGLASRAMSLVAVVKRAGDAAGRVPETRVIPVQVPEDVDFGAYFESGRRVFEAAPPRVFSAAQCSWVIPGSSLPGVIRHLADGAAGAPLFAVEESPAEPPAESSFDRLLSSAAALRPDGGMPGASENERVLASCIALLAFLDQGSDIGRGPFRQHILRLLDFLERHSAGSELSEEARAAVDALVKKTRALAPPPHGPWLERLTSLLEADSSPADSAQIETLWREVCDALDSGNSAASR